ncbi:MAG: DUF4272 domain-containing protein [Rhodospirillales bacterium]|nr:DUF4272 domain-containing protein [Rhodospirillales bacterium]
MGKLQPPSARRVLTRAYCLVVLSMRGYGETDPGIRESLDSFLAGFPLQIEFTERERSLIEAPFGSLPEHRFVEFAVVEEALRVLLWALGKVEDSGSPTLSGRHWREALEIALALAADRDFVPVLRDSDEILRAQMAEDVLRWRCRVAADKRKGAASADDRARVVEPLRYAKAAGYVKELVDDDIAVDGRPLSALSDPDLLVIRNASLIRSFALFWLMGADPDWDRAYAFTMAREETSGLEPPDFITPPPPAGPNWPRPDRDVAARRMVALATLLIRAGLEESRITESADGWTRTFEVWIQEPVVAESLSPREAELIKRPARSWSFEDKVAAQWRAEALGCLLWALGQIDEIPAYDTPFSVPLLLERCGVLQPPKVVGRPTLRDPAEIDRARDIAETWHWRARTAQAVRLGMAPPPELPLEKIIEITANAAHEKGSIPAPIDNDFPAFGKAYRLLSDDEAAIASAIAYQRHYALNWLCGYSPDWDSTRTDT